MIEKQTIKDKEVWFKVDPHPVERENSNVIPTEYFTVTYFFEQPEATAKNGELIKEQNGDVRLFASPVEAISFASAALENA